MAPDWLVTVAGERQKLGALALPCCAEYVPDTSACVTGLL